MSEDLFNFHFADLGGLAKQFDRRFSIYDDERDLDMFGGVQELMEEVSRQCTELLQNRGRDETIFVRLAAASSVNGCCFRTDCGTYLIAVNAGVIYRLRLIMFILMEVDCGNREAFNKEDREWIYNIFGYRLDDAERSLRKIDDPKIQEKLLEEASNRIKDRSNICKNDSFIGDFLAFLALDFAMLHEIQHAALGHLEKSYPLRSLYSRLWESGCSISERSEELQGIEYAADFAAGVFAGRGFAARDSGFRLSGFVGSDDIWCRGLSFSVKVALSLISFSVSLLDARHQESDHPHPELRFLIYFRGVSIGVQELDTMVNSKWRNGISEGYWAVTNAFQHLMIHEPIMWSITSNMQAWYEKFHLSIEVEQMLKRANSQLDKSMKESRPFWLPILLGGPRSNPNQD